ncbi:MAG: MnhB domain-containing protein [Halobacteriaceae archaeon]
MSTVITRTTARVVVPIIFLTAIALLLQGHNKPGGGFIAGVLTSTGFGLLYLVYSIDFVEETVLGGSISKEFQHLQNSIVADYRIIFGLGLLLSLVSGIVPILFGLPFLSQTVVFIKHVPIYHELELASAVIFDLGVYFVVVGALLSIISVVGAE